jgi:hypothetical protein
LERLRKGELIDLALRLQWPDKTRRNSSLPPSSKISGRQPALAVLGPNVSRLFPFRLLLCSDGLHGVASETEMASALKLYDPRLACERFVQAMLAAEAPDNASGGVFPLRELAESDGGSQAPPDARGLHATASE